MPDKLDLHGESGEEEGDGPQYAAQPGSLLNHQQVVSPQIHGPEGENVRAVNAANVMIMGPKGVPYCGCGAEMN